jgi:hypothetical protein
MQNIIAYSKEHPNMNVPQALNSLVQEYQMNPNNPMQQQLSQMPLQQNQMLLQQMQQQAKSMSNGPMMAQLQGSEGFLNMSPAMQAGMLPGNLGNMANGSPHLSSGTNPIGLNSGTVVGNTNLSSPAQTHMAPPMVTQQSQQGAAASAKSSPNVTAKRRRSTAAGIKGEDHDGVEVNGAGAAKVKPSPRMSNSKRAKQG